ncbi:hypothetical protein GCM10023320_34390 [Pseudonocardia adelaidensis]|uniref:Uncharacterized protein n=1 Tax=Pseudonocardia adelaidensis TaxID=648754 RepID=A0ABP9NJF1_9PSEU
MAPSAEALAAALVPHHPPPAPPRAPQVASAVARLPPPADCAWLLAAKLYRQVEPAVPWQDAETCVPFSVAPTRLEPAHCPLVPAVQSVREDALLTPPGAAAWAVPSVWVRHPVPAQVPVTSAIASDANPPVPAWQPPAAAQVAVACAFTRVAPMAFDSEEARVAQPAAVPLSQVAVTWAVVVANRCSAGTSDVVVAVEDAALIWARHAVVPSHPVDPVAVLVLRLPAGPATAVTPPVTRPVQPASGQSIWEPACACPVTPGIDLALAPLSGLSPALRVMVAVASLAATHPLAAAVHVAAVCVRPGVPLVPPVVAAVQPAPVHCAVADDCDHVAGAAVTGFAASFAASVAVLRASFAAAAASAAVFFCAAVAPGRAATFAACAARCSASVACCFACSAWLFCCSATMSATTWPEPAEESVWTWQPLAVLVQLPLEVEVPVPGGPRAPPSPFIAAGPSLPLAEVRASPVHGVPPAQSIVADAIVQLDAPGTVGPPEFADEPGATGAGGVAGWSDPCPCWSAGALPWSPVVSEDTVAFAVDRACTSGLMMFAFGSLEAPELVTAWHTPPDTPLHEPSLREPRDCADTLGSVADAALVTLPVQLCCPSQTMVAPAADAADGPATSRAVLTCWACPSACGPDRASAAPGPVDAVDVDCTWQPPVPPVQDAVPSDVRGLPFATAPSHALVVVRTEPWQAVPASQARLADEVEVEDGPDRDWPASGRPVFGSTATKSGALDAAELVSPSQPPPVTVHSAVDDVPRAYGVTPVSRALVELFAVPPHSVAAPEHCTVAFACDTLTGPDTCTTPAVAAVSPAGSRSDTVVSAAVLQLPPAPCAVQDEVPVLSRTPFTSPDAPPDVVLDPDATQLAAAQSISVSAVLDADSSRVAKALPVAAAAVCSSHDGSAARSDTCESDCTPQPPAFASHCEEALVVRTGAAAPAFAGVPVAVPVVALDAFPWHTAASQSTFAPAELEAVVSPSVSTAGRTAPDRRARGSSFSSTWLSTRVLL